MLIRVLQVLLFIFHCLRMRVRPWLFFQLNAKYFNERKGIFSKLDIDQLIPSRWRLAQYRDTGAEVPKKYPVFVKPEWGQNSVGICKADSWAELESIRSVRPEGDVPFLIQEAARGKQEFEVFLVPEVGGSRFACLSVTRTVNIAEELLPVNGIHNRETRYWDITGFLSQDQTTSLWNHLKSIGPFSMARFGIRADSLKTLVAGEFQVFEINLFIPMPLVLLADNVSFLQKLKQMNRITLQLARATGSLPAGGKRSSVFFRKMSVHQSNQEMAARQVSDTVAYQKAAVQEGAPL